MTLTTNSNWNRNVTFQVTVGKVPVPIFTISGVRIKFDVVKTTSSNANTAKITIFNLSKQSRTILETPKGILSFLPGLSGLADFSLGGVLSASYGGVGGGGVGDAAVAAFEEASGINAIFSGQFTKVTNTWAPPEWVSEIETGDGVLDLSQKIMNNTFPAGTPIASMISAAVASLGVTVGPSTPVVGGITKFGEVAAGKTKDFMDMLAKRFKFGWSIQNGAVQISTTPNTPSLTSAVLISADTGMIGHPIKTDKGVEFVSLLNPKIRPGTTISVIGNPLEDDTLNGLYIAKRVEHSGDTHAMKFLTKVEAELPGL